MAYSLRFSGDDDGPDSHGLAALVLVESLVHELIAKRVITVREAMDIVDTASGAVVEMGSELADMSKSLEMSAAVLNAISMSLSRDIPTD